ncbi:hypothetical protein ACFLTE_10600 [Bacteroidota bacterium]
MFSFLQKHKNGILGTLLFHLVVINIFFIVRMSTTQDLDSSEILIEFEEEDDFIEERVQAAIEKQPVISENINYTNYAYNLAKLKEIEEKLYKEESEINKEEINKELIDKILRETLGEEDYKKYIESETEIEKDNIVEKPEDKSEEEKIIKHIIKEGPSTLIYELENRYATNMPLPVYKCENGGVVIVFIDVSRQGYVISAKIDNTTKYYDECLLNAAINSARSSKFNLNNKAPEIQKGRIIYTFIPQ